MRILYDKDSGRSRGFGFVHFSMENDAKCAKDAMDGKVSRGHHLHISEYQKLLDIDVHLFTGISWSAFEDKFCFR